MKNILKCRHCRISPSSKKRVSGFCCVRYSPNVTSATQKRFETIKDIVANKRLSSTMTEEIIDILGDLPPICYT